MEKKFFIKGFITSKDDLLLKGVMIKKKGGIYLLTKKV